MQEQVPDKAVRLFQIGRDQTAAQPLHVQRDQRREITVFRDDLLPQQGIHEAGLIPECLLFQDAGMAVDGLDKTVQSMRLFRLAGKLRGQGDLGGGERRAHADEPMPVPSRQDGQFAAAETHLFRGAASQQDAARIRHVVGRDSAAVEQGHGVTAAHGEQQIALEEFRVEIHTVMVGREDMEIALQFTAQGLPQIRRIQPGAGRGGQFHKVVSGLRRPGQGGTRAKACRIVRQCLRSCLFEGSQCLRATAADPVPGGGHALSPEWRAGRTSNRKRREMATRMMPAQRAASSTLMMAMTAPTQTGPMTCPTRCRASSRLMA